MSARQRKTVIRTGDVDQDFKSLIKVYGPAFHSMPICKRDLEINVTISENDDGEPEFYIQGLDVIRARIVFKFLEGRIVQRSKELKKTLEFKKNGEPTKREPNIKLRLNSDESLRRKHQKILDKFLPEPVEPESQSSSSSSSSSSDGSVKRKQKETDLPVKKKPEIKSKSRSSEEIPVFRERVQTGVHPEDRLKSKRKSVSRKTRPEPVHDPEPISILESKTEPENIPSPIQSPVRSPRRIIKVFEPVSKLNSETDEEYQERRLSPRKANIIKSILINGGNMDDVEEQYKSKIEQSRRNDNLFSALPHYEGKGNKWKRIRV